MYFDNSSDDNLTQQPEMTSEHWTNLSVIHLAVVSTLRILTGWLIMANIIIIICFLLNRHKQWPLFSVQILCSSVSDLFTGFFAITFCTNVAREPQSRLGCLIIMYLLFTSQCGSLLNLFCVCVHRFLRIQNIKQQVETNSFRRAPAYMAMMAWIVSLIVCAVPVVLWNKPTQEQIPYCILEEIFTDVNGAMRYFACVLIVPQLLTNVLYVVSYLRLRWLKGRVFPSQPQTSSSNQTSSSIPIGNVVNVNNFRRASMTIQQKVLGTIGLVMFLFNICTMPVIVLMFIGIHPSYINVRYIVCIVFVLHLALNPVIYGLRSSWLKIALKKMFADFKRNILCS